MPEFYEPTEEEVQKLIKEEEIALEVLDQKHQMDEEEEEEGEEEGEGEEGDEEGDGDGDGDGDGEEAEMGEAMEEDSKRFPFLSFPFLSFPFLFVSRR